ncbi:MAG: fluoride exporter [Solirubrobacteraceae bacterium]|jgi:CrcB protein|nr:fluoride exporter [Solirubrobacteraceae bacterium]
MNGLVVLGVAALGGLGALARFGLDSAIQARRLGEFPLGTFVVNISGSLALGVLVGAGVKDDAFLLTGTAALASFTTFSTWVFEAQRLAQDGEWRVAGANLGLSLAAGLAAAAVGRTLGGLL